MCTQAPGRAVPVQWIFENPAAVTCPMNPSNLSGCVCREAGCTTRPQIFKNSRKMKAGVPRPCKTLPSVAAYDDLDKIITFKPARAFGQAAFPAAEAGTDSEPSYLMPNDLLAAFELARRQPKNIPDNNAPDCSGLGRARLPTTPVFIQPPALPYMLQDSNHGAIGLLTPEHIHALRQGKRSAIQEGPPCVTRGSTAEIECGSRRDQKCMAGQPRTIPADHASNFEADRQEVQGKYVGLIEKAHNALKSHATHASLPLASDSYAAMDSRLAQYDLRGKAPPASTPKRLSPSRIAVHQVRADTSFASDSVGYQSLCCTDVTPACRPVENRGSCLSVATDSASVEQLFPSAQNSTPHRGAGHADNDVYFSLVHRTLDGGHETVPPCSLASTAHTSIYKIDKHVERPHKNRHHSSPSVGTGPTIASGLVSLESSLQNESHLSLQCSLGQRVVTARLRGVYGNGDDDSSDYLAQFSSAHVAGNSYGGIRRYEALNNFSNEHVVRASSNAVQRAISYISPEKQLVKYHSMPKPKEQLLHATSAPSDPLLMNAKPKSSYILDDSDTHKCVPANSLASLYRIHADFTAAVPGQDPNISTAMVATLQAKSEADVAANGKGKTLFADHTVVTHPAVGLSASNFYAHPTTVNVSNGVMDVPANTAITRLPTNVSSDQCTNNKTSLYILSQDKQALAGAPQCPSVEYANTLSPEQLGCDANHVYLAKTEHPCNPSASNADTIIPDAPLRLGAPMTPQHGSTVSSECSYQEAPQSVAILTSDPQNKSFKDILEQSALQTVLLKTYRHTDADIPILSSALLNDFTKTRSHFAHNVCHEVRSASAPPCAAHSVLYLHRPQLSADSSDTDSTFDRNGDTTTGHSVILQTNTSRQSILQCHSLHPTYSRRRSHFPEYPSSKFEKIRHTRSLSDMDFPPPYQRSTLLKSQRAYLFKSTNRICDLDEPESSVLASNLFGMPEDSPVRQRENDSCSFQANSVEHFTLTPVFNAHDDTMPSSTYQSPYRMIEASTKTIDSPEVSLCELPLSHHRPLNVSDVHATQGPIQLERVVAISNYKEPALLQPKSATPDIQNRSARSNVMFVSRDGPTGENDTQGNAISASSVRQSCLTSAPKTLEEHDGSQRASFAVKKRRAATQSIVGDIDALVAQQYTPGQSHGNSSRAPSRSTRRPQDSSTHKVSTPTRIDKSASAIPESLESLLQRNDVARLIRLNVQQAVSEELSRLLRAKPGVEPVIDDAELIKLALPAQRVSNAPTHESILTPTLAAVDPLQREEELNGTHQHVDTHLAVGLSSCTPPSSLLHDSQLTVGSTKGSMRLKSAVRELIRSTSRPVQMDISNAKQVIDDIDNLLFSASSVPVAIALQSDVCNKKTLATRTPYTDETVEQLYTKAHVCSGGGTASEVAPVNDFRIQAAERGSGSTTSNQRTVSSIPSRTNLPTARSYREELGLVSRYQVESVLDTIPAMVSTPVRYLPSGDVAPIRKHSLPSDTAAAPEIARPRPSAEHELAAVPPTNGTNLIAAPPLHRRPSRDAADASIIAHVNRMPRASKLSGPSSGRMSLDRSTIHMVKGFDDDAYEMALFFK